MQAGHHEPHTYVLLLKIALKIILRYNVLTFQLTLDWNCCLEKWWCNVSIMRLYEIKGEVLNKNMQIRNGCLTFYGNTRKKGAGFTVQAFAVVVLPIGYMYVQHSPIKRVCFIQEAAERTVFGEPN